MPHHYNILAKAFDYVNNYTLLPETTVMKLKQTWTVKSSNSKCNTYAKLGCAEHGAPLVPCFSSHVNDPPLLVKKHS